MVAGSIIIDLLMRTASFETDTKRAESRLNELKKVAGRIGASIGLAFVAVGAASVALVKNSIDAADATSKLAQQTGTTVEELSALTYAAGLADVSQEELGAALVKLTKNMSDAANGSGEAAKGFEALGISVMDADGTLKSSDKVLAEIADKFAGFRDGAEKTALAVNLFGRSGAQLIPLLNAGAGGLKEMKEEAARLGLVLQTDVARSAEEFNDNLTRIGKAISGVGNVAARDLLPALNEVSRALVDLAKSESVLSVSSKVIRGVFGGLITVFQTFAVLGSDVGFVFLSVGREIGAWAAQLNALARGDLQGFRAISDAVKADGARARAELDKFQARVMAIGQPVAPGSFHASDNYGSTSESRPRAPRISSGSNSDSVKVTEAERYLERLRQQLDRTEDLSEAEKVLGDIQSGRLKLSGKVTQDQLLGLAVQIDVAKAFEESMKAGSEQAQAFIAEREKEIEASKALQKAEEDRLKTLTAGAAENVLKESLSDIEFLNAAYERGAISVGVWADSVRNATAGLQQQGDEIDEFAKNMAQNIQGYLGESLANAMEGNFSDIASSFTQMINRMVAEALAADLARRLMGSAVEGGTGGGWIGTALTYAKNAFGGAKAGGGDVMPGREYWVGEDGPEKFLPRTMGSIQPAQQSSGRDGAGAMTVNQSFIIPSGTQLQTQQQLAAAAARGLQRATQRYN